MSQAQKSAGIFFYYEVALSQINSMKTDGSMQGAILSQMLSFEKKILALNISATLQSEILDCTSEIKVSIKSGGTPKYSRTMLLKLCSANPIMYLEALRILEQIPEYSN